jgi:hypothetical protein
LLVCRDSTGKFFRTPGNYRVLQKPILPCQFLSECLFVFSLVLSSYRLLLFVAFDSSLTFDLSIGFDNCQTLNVNEQ